MKKPDRHQIICLMIMIDRLRALVARKALGEAELGEGYEAVELADALAEAVRELYPEVKE